MKYLKKFNEKLNSRTYLSASRKLAKKGHTERSNRLKEWSEKVEEDEYVAN